MMHATPPASTPASADPQRPPPGFLADLRAAVSSDEVALKVLVASAMVLAVGWLGVKEAVGGVIASQVLSEAIKRWVERRRLKPREMWLVTLLLLLLSLAQHALAAVRRALRVRRRARSQAPTGVGAGALTSVLACVFTVVLFTAPELVLGDSLVDNRKTTFFGGATAPERLTLTVTLAGKGGGVVLSDPPGIRCSRRCSASFAAGREVTLTPTGGTGSRFAGWTGACTGRGPCKLDFHGRRSVGAIFGAIATRVLRVRARGGTVSLAPAASDGTQRCTGTCSVAYAAGIVVRLTPLPVRTFANWEGACSEARAGCTLTMNADRRTTAMFRRPIRTHSLAIDVHDGTVFFSPPALDGTDACRGTCRLEYERGKKVVLGAEPRRLFTGWTGDCTGAQPECRRTMHDDLRTSAAFRRPAGAHTLTIRVENGEVSLSPAALDGTRVCFARCELEYEAGGDVRLLATPARGFAFRGWGSGCDKQRQCELSMHRDRSASVSFRPQTRTLTITSKDGTVSVSPGVRGGADTCPPDCLLRYEIGARVTLSAQPGDGFLFGGWRDGCTGTDLRCELTIDRNRSATATFRHPKLTINVQGGGVSVSPADLAGTATCKTDCTLEYRVGDTVALTATPDRGYRFSGWQGACTGRSCEVPMTGDRSVTAVFHRLRVLTMFVNRGSVSVDPAPRTGRNVCPARKRSCRFVYESDGTVTLTARPWSGSRLTGWSGECKKPTGSRCRVRMDVDRRARPIIRRVHTLELTIDGPGSVSLDPADLDDHIACPAKTTRRCVFTYLDGQGITLTATPDSPTTMDRKPFFHDWKGACADPEPGTRAGRICQLSMGFDQATTAVFRVGSVLG